MNLSTSTNPKEGYKFVLRKTWDCWSPGTALEVIEYTDNTNSALVRIGSRGHREQVVIPLDYITERRR